METESNECMQLAEKKKELSFVIKGNTLKRKVNKQTKNLPLCKRRSPNLK